MKEQEKPLPGRRRVVIENITPRVDPPMNNSAFAIKRVVGETVQVQADAFADGHDVVKAQLLYRHERQTQWQQLQMNSIGNDRWEANFIVEQQGCYEYTVRAWIDHYATWERDIARKKAAGQDVSVDLLRGKTLKRQPDPEMISQHAPPLAVTVDRERARFSSWYELFPRSHVGANDKQDSDGKSATFAELQARIPYIAAMGFDVLYLPPIHPIGVSHRKGTNNTAQSKPSDPGSPWGIGSKEGGHKDIHPELGTLKDFQNLLAAARRHDIEIALDVAFQTSPDHPYVQQHPEWFAKRPDGTIQYAENPPKKYQDIYPFDFESAAWPTLWEELKSIVEYWAAQGVRIFRVDNPHTKPFALWQWLITEIKKQYPDALFLSEAFTRPKVMYRLAKLGFTQSYTYFAWRNTRSELENYFTELTQTPVKEFFRPNLWPNTPDILTEYLQFGGRPAFMIRATLAATLGASWGMYGPAFELMEHEARDPGSEEYRDSEKYEIRHWDLNRPGTLKDFIARLNKIRRENPALQTDRTLRFHTPDNDSLICYSKSTDDQSNIILTVVNLDPHHPQTGWITLNLDALDIDPDINFQTHDLLSGARFLWRGARNFVSLDPNTAPAHIFLLRRRSRSERDFDYYL